MVKPFYKSMIKSNLVEVEDFGTIDLSELPIRVRKDEKGIYEICWVKTYVDGRVEYVLSECGGTSMFNYGGRILAVIN